MVRGLKLKELRICIYYEFNISKEEQRDAELKFRQSDLF